MVLAQERQGLRHGSHRTAPYHSLHPGRGPWVAPWAQPVPVPTSEATPATRTAFHVFPSDIRERGEQTRRARANGALMRKRLRMLFYDVMTTMVMMVMATMTTTMMTMISMRS